MIEYVIIEKTSDSITIQEPLKDSVVISDTPSDTVIVEEKGIKGDKGDKGDRGDAGTGDMEKAIYDTNADGVVDDAERLGGLPAANYLKQNDSINGGYF